MGIVWTLRARGLAPSLGAGGSLVVAALCCLLFATALLTFRDWPGRGDASPGGTIAMSPPAGKAAGRVASGPSPAVAASAAAPAAASRPTRRDRRSAPRRAPQAPAGTSPPAAAAPAPAAPAPAAGAPAPATQPAASAPQRPASTSPQPARDPGPIEGTVETGREVTKPLPPAVREPIQPVLDTVQAVGKTVDDTVAPLLPALP